MISQASDIERIATISKQLLKERRAYDRVSEKTLSGGHSSKQAQRLNVDLNWKAMHIVKLEADLHAACVDAGVADLREPRHYAERIARPSAWHQYPWTPAQPRSLAE